MTRAARRSSRCCCGGRADRAVGARVAQQDERIARLERETKCSSRNSSQPPSQDPPGAPECGKDPSGRGPGGQPGHEGKGRPLLPAWAVDEVVAHWPVDCECGHAFGVADRVAAGAPARHQVEELPVMAVRVTEHRCQRVRCPDCGARRTGQLPAPVAVSAFEPRLQAAVVTLSVRNHNDGARTSTGRIIEGRQAEAWDNIDGECCGFRFRLRAPTRPLLLSMQGQPRYRHSRPPRPWTHRVRWIAPDPQRALRLLVAIELDGLIRPSVGGWAHSSSAARVARVFRGSWLSFSTPCRTVRRSAGLTAESAHVAVATRCGYGRSVRCQPAR